MSAESWTRRQWLNRLSLMAAAAGLPTPVVNAVSAEVETMHATWVASNVAAIEVPGYGRDPNLVQPIAEPWPRTLTPDQLALVEVLSDILIPADESSPAASEVGVPAVVDHWLSAPYPLQHRHRLVVLAGLDWLQEQSMVRFKKKFAQSDASQKLEIVDEIAFEWPPQDHPLYQPTVFFDLLRRLVAGAYYSSPAGLQALGYQGNVPIAGDYPGPTKAALEHLNQQMDKLGLSL